MLVCIPLASTATSHLFAAADDGPLPALASALVTEQGAEERARVLWDWRPEDCLC